MPHKCPNLLQRPPSDPSSSYRTATAIALQTAAQQRSPIASVPHLLGGRHHARRGAHPGTHVARQAPELPQAVR